LIWLVAPAAWAGCATDADCGSGEVCDLGACLEVAMPQTAPEASPDLGEELPLAVPLHAEPTPLALPSLHPGLSYAESAWNVALRNEIETWILFGLVTYGGLNLVANIAFQDPSWATLELLGAGGLVTYGIVTSWKGAKAGRAGLGRLGIGYDGSLLEQVAWGGYAASLVCGAVAIVSLWVGQNNLARATTGMSVIAAVGSLGVMQAESIRTRRMLADTMDKLDPARTVSVTPVVGPTEGGMTFGIAGTF
jgi:Cys-rich repeat protein